MFLSIDAFLSLFDVSVAESLLLGLNVRDEL
jgi:hypothetical protein